MHCAYCARMSLASRKTRFFGSLVTQVASLLLVLFYHLISTNLLRELRGNCLVNGSKLGLPGMKLFCTRGSDYFLVIFVLYINANWTAWERRTTRTCLYQTVIYCLIHSLCILDKSSPVTRMKWDIIILRFGTSKFTRAETWGGGRAGQPRKHAENSNVIAGVKALLCTYRIKPRIVRC